MTGVFIRWPHEDTERDTGRTPCGDRDRDWQVKEGQGLTATPEAN